MYLAILLAVDGVQRHVEAVFLPLALIVYQTINFHHYIVDSMIWKLRRKPLQETLGVAKP